MTKSPYNLRAIPLWAAVVPLVTINVCFVIAAGLDHVPSCIPYISGCTSVSSTGRMAPESLIFRAGMLPTAVILVMFWHHCATFLELGGQRGRRLAAFRVLGIVAALSLTVYALTLGFEENVYRQLRRAGIIGFAVSTLAAEVMFMVGTAQSSRDTFWPSRRWCTPTVTTRSPGSSPRTRAPQGVSCCTPTSRRLT